MSAGNTQKFGKPATANRSGNNTGLIIGGSIALGIFLIALAIALWWIFYKRKSVKNYQQEIRKKSGRTKIITKTPKIQVNTIEFTVPIKNSKYDTIDDYQANETHSTKRRNSDAVASKDSSYDSDARSDPGSAIATGFGLLRPDLYPSDSESVNDDEEYASCTIGRIWFRLEYDCETENLFVTLIKVKKLPARHQRGGSLSMAGSSTCDPFVRIYLLPDEKRYLQSKMKKKTRNPHFNQTFAFSMSYSVLRERTLRFTVFDVDRFMRQTVIGHALYSLENLDITMTTEESLDLEKLGLPSSDSIGDIQVTLTYFSGVNRIAVTIAQVTNLHHPDFPTLNPYVKITHSVLGKVIKSKKTLVHRETTDPQFNHCFEFKINPDVLEKTCFTIEIMHSTSPVLKQDKFIGRVDIGGPLVSRGKELDHWSAAISRANTPVKEWHDLKR